MLPLPDVTIDTDVLMHASDPRQTTRLACQALLIAVLAGPTRLCLDQGFHAVPSSKKSLIAAEYFDRLVPGTLGHQFVQTLAADQRIHEVPLRTPPGVNTIINGLVRASRDKTFLRVAYNSDSQRLYSHDRQHFPRRVRDAARSRLGVTISDP